jgi:hypothetical protein
MARFLGKLNYSSKKLDAVLSEWQQYSEVVKLNTYHFALRFLSPLDVKNDELSVAIGAAAYSIITGQWFDNSWHDKLTETCSEGYEAGFIVRDIVNDYRERYSKTLLFNE